MKEKDKIEIRNFLNRLEIEISDNKIFISEKSLLKSLEYEIGLDEIDLKKTVKSELNHSLMAIGYISIIFGIIINIGGGTYIFAVLFLIGVLFIISGLIFKKRSVTILSYSSKPLILRFNKINERKVRYFSDKILDKSKEYLIKKFSRIDKDLPAENQLNGIDFLRTKDLISETEFMNLKNKLLGKKENSKPIGFE